MEQIVCNAFQWIEKFMEVMTDEKAWYYHQKETKSVDEMHDGDIAIYREPYTAEEWKWGQWRNVRKYRYNIGVKCGDKILGRSLDKDGQHKYFKYTHEWHLLIIDDKIYQRAVKAKQKEEAEKEAARLHRIAMEEAEKQRVKEMEEEAERKRKEAQQREYERLEQPMVITVGMWEELQRKISDMQEQIENLDRYDRMDAPCGEW